ncbi:MAG: YidC/Oxa1 family membrane protein insertase [Lachnospiraceae bacterium]|nr:YidC/Oxa1 family membrane protein insertase [Lachnospiraceae bacterium]
MNPLFMLAASEASAPATFFYENWFFIKPFIWIFGQIMSGIMWLLDKVGIYNIALCIVLFTIVTKMLLLPFTIKQQKTARMQAVIQPEIQALQKKYQGKTDSVSRQKMYEEQQAIQQKYGVSMFSGCLPMLLQMPILFALYPVIYRMQTQYVPHYQVLKETLPADVLQKMWVFLGINLLEAPGWRLTPAILIPILVAVTQFLSTKLLTSKQMPQDGSMSAMKSMNYIMPVMLGVFAVSFPAFLGLYWLVQSLVMAIQQLIINKHLDKIPVEDLIKENVEKANKKRARKGLPPISDKANMSTRQMGSSANVSTPGLAGKAAAAKKTDYSGLSAEEKEAMVKESKEYYAKKAAAAPGSLAAKANMVRDYNERNKK